MRCSFLGQLAVSSGLGGSGKGAGWMTRGHRSWWLLCFCPLPSGTGQSSAQLPGWPPCPGFEELTSGGQCPLQVAVLAQVGLRV